RSGSDGRRQTALRRRRNTAPVHARPRQQDHRIIRVGPLWRKPANEQRAGRMENRIARLLGQTVSINQAHQTERPIPLRMGLSSALRRNSDPDSWLLTHYFSM